MLRKFFCFAQRSGEPLGGIAALRAAIKSRSPDFRQKKFGFFQIHTAIRLLLDWTRGFQAW